MAGNDVITIETVRRRLDAMRREVERERRESLSALVADRDCPWPATLLFHRHSALGPHWAPGMTVEETERHTQTLDYARFPGLPRIDLPRAVASTALLSDVLRTRRSRRDYDYSPLPLVSTATLLQLACGVTADESPPKRAAPSGGALYPVETYVLALDVCGLDAGVFHYSPLAHALTRLRPLQGTRDLTSFLPPGLTGNHIPLVVVLTARFARTAKKYVERGYRFALLEAGHIGQNLSLVAESLGLGSTCLGGFWDDPANELLGLDPDEEAAIYMVMVGHPIGA
jgi:SagB-type dehydrogenase family enzyme